MQLEEHRRGLFGLCYRMTGSAAEAEDLVQETFRRALERPPADLDAPLRPWLTRVATNLCIDTLRKRKSERYFGPWLPEPVPTAELEADLEPSPEARYGVLESATMAFLLALEELTPRERAVLLLRDVLGLSGPEVGETLGLGESNVRVTHHRARKALEGYDGRRFDPRPDARARNAERLRALIVALTVRDGTRLTELLAEDARSTSDGGGEVHAAVVVVRGKERVRDLCLNLMALYSLPRFASLGDYNGAASLAVEVEPHGERYPRRWLFQIDLDDGERIAELRTVLAPSKLARVQFQSG